MITKDIIKNGQFASQVPSLETVNHRLNIFKKKSNSLSLIINENKQERLYEDKKGLITEVNNYEEMYNIVK